MKFQPTNLEQDVATLIASLRWYHTLELGNGIVTPGIFDHRPYLENYRLPHDLIGKTVLDVGPSSGFFSFEFEKRGGQVTAVDIPDWSEVDYGPNHPRKSKVRETAFSFQQPFEVAKSLLASNVVKKFINIYDISPATIGVFDIVFCGSLLIHLTDPLRALWNIAQVTKEKAIIATTIIKDELESPIALYLGHDKADSWWAPTRTCLELMVASAGFVGIEWISEFQLNYREGSEGPYHGVLHAYKTTDNWTPRTVHRDTIFERQLQAIGQVEQRLRESEELMQLKQLVKEYERGRFMRFMRWIHRYKSSMMSQF